MCCCVCSSIIIFFNVGMCQGDPLVGLLFVLAHFHILCYYVGVFPLFLFLTLALPMLFPLFLCFPIGLCGVVYSTPQLSTWACLSYLLGLSPYRVLLPLNISRSLACLLALLLSVFFLEKALNEDVQHVNMFLKLGDI